MWETTIKKTRVLSRGIAVHVRTARLPRIADREHGVVQEHHFLSRIYGGKHGDVQERSAMREEALAAHDRLIALIKEGEPG